MHSRTLAAIYDALVLAHPLAGQTPAAAPRTDLPVTSVEVELCKPVPGASTP